MNTFKYKKGQILLIWIVFLSGLNIHIYAFQKIAAVVNGTKISENTLLYYVNKKLPLISIHQRVSEKRFNAIKTKTLNHLIDDELIGQEALRHKIVVDKNKLNSKINMMKNGYASEERFYSELAKTQNSYAAWVSKVKKSLMVEQFIRQEISDKIKITDQDVFAYYLKNKKKFVIPPRLEMSHILINVQPGSMKPGWEAGLQKAENVYVRLKSGEPFALVAQEVSDDTLSNKKGGDIGWLHLGQLIPELDAVAQKMKINEISKPVRTIYGYHILKLNDKKREKQLSFKEINVKKWKKKLYDFEFMQKEKELIGSLRKKAVINVFY